jgi:ABC-type lipoprotein release transport system permease subunit
VHSISIVDITLTVFVLFLLLIIATTIIKRFIDNNRVNIGVAQAIGIEKHKIAFSLLPFGLISSVIGGVLGYLLGLFLQIPTLGLLSAY